MPKDQARWLFVLQSWTQIWSPSGVSFSSSAFHTLHHSIEQHDLWTLSLTISMLMIASYLFPLLQGTLLWHWMVYSHVWPPSSHGYWRINWNWTQIKLNSSLSGTNDSSANTSLCFLLSFSVSKLTLLNLLGILAYFSTKIPPSSHIYQQSVAHAFTICGICGVVTATLIWIVQI